MKRNVCMKRVTHMVVIVCTQGETANRRVIGQQTERGFDVVHRRNHILRDINKTFPLGRRLLLLPFERGFVDKNSEL